MLTELKADISESYQIYESIVWLWVFLATMAFWM